MQRLVQLGGGGGVGAAEAHMEVGALPGASVDDLTQEVRPLTVLVAEEEDGKPKRERLRQ